ncbi:MAG: hypothetical protein V4580_11100 [Bacteroidota bacterium]
MISNTNNSYYYENDKKGNSVFSRNNGMNGPITMISFLEYDSLNRITKSYFAHSNIGYYLSETLYQNSKVTHYSYTTDSRMENDYNRELLNKIHTKKEFIYLKAYTDLHKSKKVISSIDSLDKFGNVVSELTYSETGDTSSYHTYKFNEHNKEILFHFGTKDSESWTWDIYSVYDSNLNRLKSFRISSENGLKDTSEVYNYIYDSTNHLLESNYYHHRVFKNKTLYQYDKNHKVKKETFYEGDQTVVDVITEYEYNKYDLLIKKVTYDSRNVKNKGKETCNYTYTYW